MLLFIIQNSSLWRRLILVPTRIVIIYSCRNLLIISSLLSIMVVLVFVGGLLVLLVRITALSYQEQGVRTNYVAPLIILIALRIHSFITMKINHETEWLTRISWITTEPNIIIMILIILTLTLVVISWFFTIRKTLTRSL